MPSRGPTTPDEILEAFVRRLRLKIAPYNDQNCFVSDQPVPDFLPAGKEACTVALGDGTFVAAMFGGGGFGTLTEDLIVTVTSFIRHVRDRPPQRVQRLMSGADGLLVRRRQILSALLIQDPEGTGVWPGDNDLVSADGSRYLLRDQLSPAGTTAPGEVNIGEAQLIAAAVQFHAPFDWSLGDPAGEACAYLDQTTCPPTDPRPPA